MGSDFDQQSLEHLIAVLPERDRGILIAVGGILALDKLSPKSARCLIRNVRRRVSKQMAEANFELETGGQS